jgi:hypothetical protein
LVPDGGRFSVSGWTGGALASLLLVLEILVALSVLFSMRGLGEFQIKGGWAKIAFTRAREYPVNSFRSTPDFSMKQAG